MKNLRSFFLGLFVAVAFSAGAFIGGGTASSVPSGVCFDYAGTSVPNGYQVADGSALVRAGSTLFGITGTTWGAGDGSTTFNVPDFRRRVTVGSGGAGTGTLANTVGSTGGEETHTLTAAEIPAHQHNIGYANPGSGASTIPAVSTTGGAPITNLLTDANTGGGSAHNVIQPSAVVLKICKL